MRTYLITGAVGFVGTQVCDQLLTSGNRIIGIDSINNSYDPAMKQMRLKQLQDHNCFEFQVLLCLTTINDNYLHTFLCKEKNDKR